MISSPRSDRTAASIAILALVFIAVSVRTRAQSEPPAPPPPGGDVFYQRIGPGPLVTAGAMGFIGFEPGFRGKTVTGAPFTASISTQTTQTLADGNVIQRTTTGTIARDSQGRTRRDITLPAIGAFAASGQTPPHAIDINDPVAGVQYMLEPDRKIAHKMQQRGHGGRGKHLNAATSVPTAPDPDNQNEVTTSSLGTQTINGVEAQGTRYTRTIPAGQIGNAKPITIVTERWYSPDLQIEVMNKRTDPAGGDSVFQLTDIQRQEPDATLFQVPSDYTVKQGGPAVMIRRSIGRGPLPPPPPDAVPDTAPAPQN
jgi:hypothetical protein